MPCQLRTFYAMTDKELKHFYHTAAWQKKRLQILARDNYECQACRKRIRDANEAGIILDAHDRKIRRAVHVHHIAELRDRPELGLDDDNLISLCHECHDRMHGRSAEHLQAFAFVRKKKPVTEEKW